MKREIMGLEQGQICFFGKCYANLWKCFQIDENSAPMSVVSITQHNDKLATIVV